MRKREGWLFSIAAKVSLLLLIVTTAAWIASYLAFAPFGQYWGTSWDGNSGGELARGWIALNGSFHFFRNDTTHMPAPTSEPFRYRHSGIDPKPNLQLQPTSVGFARYYLQTHSRLNRPGAPRVTWTTQQISFPLWLPAILFAILPVRMLLRRRADRSRERHGLCSNCSYNLFGNSSGVCPECGLAVTPL